MNKDLRKELVHQINQDLYEARKREERQRRIDHQNSLREVNLDVTLEAIEEPINKPLIPRLLSAFMQRFKTKDETKQRQTHLETAKEALKRRETEFDFLFVVGVVVMAAMLLALAWNFLSQMSYFFS